MLSLSQHTSTAACQYPYQGRLRYPRGRSGKGQICGSVASIRVDHQELVIW